MPINSKKKGARFELTVSKKLKELGINARRGQQFNGLEGEDVVSDLDWNIECKAVERLNIDKAFEQSARDADPGKTPVVIHKRNLKPILITLKLEDFEVAAKEFIAKVDLAPDPQTA